MGLSRDLGLGPETLFEEAKCLADASKTERRLLSGTEFDLKPALPCPPPQEMVPTMQNAGQDR